MVKLSVLLTTILLIRNYIICQIHNHLNTKEFSQRRSDKELIQVQELHLISENVQSLIHCMVLVQDKAGFVVVGTEPALEVTFFIPELNRELFQQLLKFFKELRFLILPHFQMAILAQKVVHSVASITGIRSCPCVLVGQQDL